MPGFFPILHPSAPFRPLHIYDLHEVGEAYAGCGP